MPLNCYVLYIEHDNRPHDVTAHETREEAELLALVFAQNVWLECEGGDDDEDDFPPNERLAEILVENNEYVRLYRCTEDGSEDLELRCFTAPQSEEAA